MTSLKEFLSGEPLTYKSAVSKGRVTATYVIGVGISLDKNGRDLGTADVTDDLGASRAYYNLTRGEQT